MKVTSEKSLVLLLSILFSISSCKSPEVGQEGQSDAKGVVKGTGTDCVVETDSSIKDLYDNAQDPFKQKILKASGCKAALGKKDPYSILDFMQKAGCTPQGRFLVSEKGMFSITSESGLDPRTIDEWKCSNSAPTFDEKEDVINRVWFSGPGPAMHIISWDQSSKSFNFYSADHPSSSSQIFFHGNSHVQATTIANTFRHPCTNCHIGGGLLMKELHFPWTFWHSDAHQLPGVTSKSWIRGSSPVQKPIAAERFERSTIASITMANQSYVSGLGQGKTFGAPLPQNVRAPIKYKDLLYPLFCDKGIEVASADLDAQKFVQVPWSLMLNRLLVPKNGKISLTAGISSTAKGQTSRLDMTGDLDDTDFSGLPTVRQSFASAPKFFEAMSSQNKVPGRIPMIFPTRNFADDDIISRLVLEGLITEDFAVNILLVDLQNPIFSDTRCKLLEKIPGDRVVPAAKQEFASSFSKVLEAFESSVKSDANVGNPGSGSAKYLAMKGTEDKANFVQGFVASCKNSFANPDALPTAMAHRWVGFKKPPTGIAKPYLGGDFNRAIEDFVEKEGIPKLNSGVVLAGITQSCQIM
jgi:hypothetical protein